MKRLLLVLACLLATALVFAAAPVAASGEKKSQGENEFQFHIGDAFIARLGLPLGDVSRASNGDTILVIGTGAFEVGDGEVHGRGTFEHRTADGTLFASGTWRAKELVSFTNFGPQAGAPPDFRGGRAVIVVRVIAHPASNPEATIKLDATFTVDCALGNVPAGIDEGITVNAGFINFDQKVSGFTLFVADD
jgi:hypothetical protein